ncbi:MAG: hypothetical protein ACLFP2_05335 [Candidatus Woesearchaeota archaeon]
MKRILVLLVLASFAFALDCSEIQESVKGVELPDFLPYKNEAFNFYIADEPVANAVIEEREVTSVSCEEGNSTYNVYVDSKATIEKIAASENPLETLQDMLGSEIEVKGTTFSKKVKGFFTRIGISVASWFS